MDRAFGGRGVDVSSLHQDATAIKSHRGVNLAASGQLPVPDQPARAYSTGGMQGTRCGPGHSAMGGATVTVHVVVRALRHKRVASIRSQRRHEDLAAQPVRGVGVMQRVVPRGQAFKLAEVVAGSVSMRSRQPRGIVT